MKSTDYLIIILSLVSFLPQQLSAAGSNHLSDPTKPLINTNARVNTVVENKAVEKVKLNIQLQAIYYRSKTKKAVIDNQLVTVGEKVSGYTVERIEARQVVLRLGRTLKKLRLSPSIKVTKKKG